MGIIEDSVKKAGYIKLKHAIKRFDTERDYYKKSIVHAVYFLQDTISGKLYPLKVLIALVYMDQINYQNPYYDFKNEFSFSGKKEHKSAIEEIIGKNNSNYRILDIDEEINRIEEESESFEGLNRMSMVKTRVNQSTLRNRLLSQYSECALCGVSLVDILIVSHIKPWGSSTPKERTSSGNVLLLCPNHDRLFDRHLISFNNSGSILISDKVSLSDRQLLNIHFEDRLNIEVSKSMKEFMKIHREEFTRLNAM